MQIAIHYRTSRTRAAVLSLGVGLAAMRIAFPERPMDCVRPRALLDEAFAAVS